MCQINLIDATMEQLDHAAQVVSNSMLSQEQQDVVMHHLKNAIRFRHVGELGAASWEFQAFQSQLVQQQRACDDESA